MSRIDLKYTTITLMDGASHTLNIKVGEGNLTWTEAKNRDYYLDRGLLDTVRDGDQVPLDIKLDFTWEFLKADSGDPPTPVEFIKKIGAASAYVSSDSDTCAPYAVDIRVTYDPNCSAEKREQYLFSDFRYEKLDYDIKAATISVAGKCNVTDAAVSRLAQT